MGSTNSRERAHFVTIHNNIEAINTHHHICSAERNKEDGDLRLVSPWHFSCKSCLGNDSVRTMERTQSHILDFLLAIGWEGNWQNVRSSGQASLCGKRAGKNRNLTCHSSSSVAVRGPRKGLRHLVCSYAAHRVAAARAELSI